MIRPILCGEEKESYHRNSPIEGSFRFLSFSRPLPPPRGWHAKKWKNSRHVRSPAIAIRIDWQRSSMLDFYRRWQAPVEDEKVAYQRCNVPGIILGPFEAPINYVQRMKASSPLFFFLTSFVHRPASLLSLLPLRCSLFFFSLSLYNAYIDIFESLSLSLLGIFQFLKVSFIFRWSRVRELVRESSVAIQRPYRLQKHEAFFLLSVEHHFIGIISPFQPPLVTEIPLIAPENPVFPLNNKCSQGGAILSLSSKFFRPRNCHDCIFIDRCAIFRPIAIFEFLYIKYIYIYIRDETMKLLFLRKNSTFLFILQKLGKSISKGDYFKGE